MEWIVPLLVAVVTSGAFSGVVSAIITNRQKKDPIKNALRMLLRDKLEDLILKQLVDGSITIERRRIIHEMWQTYEDLGGNGELAKLMEDLYDLPIK